MAGWENICLSCRYCFIFYREYLVAEWISELLKKDTSRRRIEDLLFTTQYGLPVIVPIMRAVLPWLAILNEKIRNKLCQSWPEVLFEGGDPSQLPIELRKKILREVCSRMGSGEPLKAIKDFTSIQRFANSDLIEDIKEFLYVCKAGVYKLHSSD